MYVKRKYSVPDKSVNSNGEMVLLPKATFLKMDKKLSEISRLHFLDWVCNLLIREVQKIIIHKTCQKQSYDKNLWAKL